MRTCRRLDERTIQAQRQTLGKLRKELHETGEERDLGYEFLRRWQELATVAMRRLGEVDELTLPDDTRTRQVLLELVDLLGLDTSWPLDDVLTKLCDAADHLLKDHDCDAHGWELVGSARDAGRAILQRLSARRPS